jgi:hypothetical protein
MNADATDKAHRVAGRQLYDTMAQKQPIFNPRHVTGRAP